ncbi:MAG: hypothetical protein QXZ02_02830 [Candidatus Bathyarchaeia archaeon]
MKIERLIDTIRSAQKWKEVGKLERNMRQTIIEYLERNIRSDHLAKFKRAALEQDKLLEKKALLKKLK